MKDGNIISVFIEQVKLHPGKVVLEFGQERFTSNDLYRMMGNYQVLFKAKGLIPGSRVLVLHPASPALFAALLALIGMGVSVVFVEEWTRMKDIVSCHEKIKCDLILTNLKGRILTFFYPGLGRLKSFKINNGIVPAGTVFQSVIVGIDHPAIISFSSGTSGPSKAVIRTHGVLKAQFDALSQQIRIPTNGKMCTNFPVVILMNLGLGMNTFISPHVKMSNLPGSDMKGLYLDIINEKITHIAFSPYLLRILADEILRFEKGKPQLEQIITGGSPVFPAYVRNFESAFDSKNITVFYGSSEAEPIAFCDAKEITEHAHLSGLFAGRIHPDCLCKILKMQGTGIEFCETGRTGEIIVGGKHVAISYLNSEEAFKRNKLNLEGVIWHRTGDFGYLTAEGYLMLTGNPNYSEHEYTLSDIEKKLAEIEGIEYGTVLQNVAYIQSYPGTSGFNIEAEIRKLLPFVRKIKIHKMPLDKRHNGKIRYGLLSGI